MFRSRKHGHRWRSTAAAAVATLACLLASAGNVWAISAPIQVSGTSGEGVFIRPEPNTSQPALGWMPEGASPEYNCFTHGEMIGTVSVWFNVTYNGVTGYYASFYDNSSYKNDAELTAKYGVPACGSAPPVPPTESPPETPPTEAPGAHVPVSESPSNQAPLGVSFNRTAAVAWATKNAKDKPPYESSCTWFVSKALWAGGLPQTAAWTSAGGHGHPWSHRPGSVDAWAVPNFVQYILSTYPHSTFTEISLTGNKVPAAEPGDVIAYDWEGKSTINNFTNLKHLALVVSISPGQYPDVAEWSIYNGTQPTPYVSRGWTWSEKTHKWLQKEYPGMKAFLLHIDTSQ
ncbi:MAG TPA: amidase domain-containing protein [Chloroflexota bacterium]|jgi:hypothetical protein|nr:amidase domain-containing protein [Chloroflexota bacterium]